MQCIIKFMKIIICPDSFKGCLGSPEVAMAIQKGMKKFLPDAGYVLAPMADGGEGTVDVLLSAIGGRKHKTVVRDPLGRKIKAEYAILQDGTGVIEMASASGLPLLRMDERNPLITSTYGTGQLILELVKKKVKSILVGVGGSATVDGGAGMAMALGVNFYSESGENLREGGGFLGKLAKIDTSGINRDILETKITVLCDVNNPLTGRYGASRIFGPQKGADGKMVKLLDRNLRHYAGIIRKQLKKDIEHIAGSGAAGGLAAGLVAFLNADIRDGSRFIAEKIGLEKNIRDAHLIITGEGRIDSQVRYGKVLLAVIETARKYKKPVIAVCGQISGDIDFLHRSGLSAVFSITPGPVSLEDAMKHSRTLIENTSTQIAGLLRCFYRNNLNS